MFASFRKHFSNITQIFKFKSTSNSSTPVVEIATIQVPPPPDSNPGNTVFIETVIDDDIVEEAHDTEESNPRENAKQDITDNYILLAYHIAFSLAISLNAPDASDKRSYLKLVLFLITAICSVLDPLRNFKWLYLKDPVKYVISLGYYLNVFLVKLSWIFVSAKRTDDIKELLKMLHEGKKYFPESHNKNTVVKSIGIILGVSVLQCSLHLVQSELYWEYWTPAEAVKSRAYDLSHTAMVWDGSTANCTEAYIESFTDEVNFITVPLAVLSFAMEAVALSHGHICMAILLAIALSFRAKVLEFCSELRKPTSIAEGKIPERVWNMYLHLKSFSELCNWIYGLPVSFLQVESFMLGAFFVNNSMDVTDNKTLVMFLLSIVLKHVVFYVCLAASSMANEAFRAWVIKNFSDKTMVEIENGPVMTMYALVEELNSKPIELKSNSSLINNAFIVQLVGGVVYIFFLLLDRREKEK